MTQYNTLNIKLSNSQLNKLKSGMLLGTLGASLLGSLLTFKSTIRKSEGIVRICQDF